MAPDKGEEAGSIFDEDSEQSKPLLGADYDSDGVGNKTLRSSAKKVAEYLPVAAEKLSVVHRLLRGLYGHLPREDVPRIIWVRPRRCRLLRVRLREACIGFVFRHVLVPEIACSTVVK